MEGLV